MYHSAFSPAMVSSPFGRAQQFARMYAQVGLETQVEAASPHQLVLMLFDGFLESVGRARLAMQAKLIEVKCQQIGRAVRILDEGLRAALDLEAGGDVAHNLHALYSYVISRLTLANLRNDVSILEEADRLIRPIREAWVEIGPQVARGARA
ncbi:flagellar protein FliS [Sphaerotilus sp. FB-3]|mgnify:FL=1|jgi:flagellar protein FliS|nr:flagellar protein FliS [Sphaerotilus natans]GKQ56280.1 flagellar protein FliS [Sphaerotilus sp. FB-3]